MLPQRYLQSVVGTWKKEKSICLEKLGASEEVANELRLDQWAGNCRVDRQAKETTGTDMEAQGLNGASNAGFLEPKVQGVQWYKEARQQGSYGIMKGLSTIVFILPTLWMLIMCQEVGQVWKLKLKGTRQTHPRSHGAYILVRDRQKNQQINKIQI